MKNDYELLSKTFQRLQIENPKITLKQFAETEGIPASTLKSGFKALERRRKAEKGKTKKTTGKQGHSRKYNWNELKSEFMGGSFKNLSDFARSKAINPRNNNFRKQTKGWGAEKGQIVRDAEIKAAELFTNEKAAEFHARRLALCYLCLEIIEDLLAQRIAFQKMILSPKDGKDLVAMTNECLKFVNDSSVQVSVLQKQKEFSEIIETLVNGGDVTEAALRLTKLGIALPDSVKILLSKAPQEDPDDGQAWSSLSMEELESRLEAGALITDEEEHTWRPKRLIEVKKIKEETKTHSSFDPAAIDKEAMEKTA